MLARSSLIMMLLAIVISPSYGLSQTDWPTNNTVPTSYIGNDSASSADGTIELVDQLMRMESRLRELESQVQDKVESQPSVSDNRDTAKRSFDDDKFEERFEKIEESVKDNGEAIEDLDGTLPGLLFHSHKNPKMTFFGRVHTDYWGFPTFDDTLSALEPPDPESRFGFRRLRIGVKGDLNDNMLYKYEGEFADGINPSYRDAYLGFKNLPLLKTLLIGNQKRPYGWDHLNSSRYNVFIERPFIVEAFNQDARRLGICSYGVSENQKCNWRLGVFNEQLTQTSSGYIGDSMQLEIAGRLATCPWYDESSGGRGWAHFAISGSAGDPNGSPGSTNNQARYRTRPEARSSNRWLDTGAIDGAETNLLLGVESVVNVGAFQVAFEYLRTNVDRTDALFEDVAFDGFYVEAAYMLTGEHMPIDRKSGTLGRMKPFENFFMIRDCDGQRQRGSGAWQLSARYSYADLTDKDIVGGVGKSMTLGLNWYWNPYARMQFNYINGDITRQPLAFGDYDIIGARLMVDF